MKQTLLKFSKFDVKTEIEPYCTNVDVLQFKAINAIVKEREPDPGLCHVVAVDFEEKTAVLSNGVVRFSWSFDKLVFIGESE